MSPESNDTDGADGLEAAEEIIDEEPEPGLGPGADEEREDESDGETESEHEAGDADE